MAEIDLINNGQIPNGLPGVVMRKSMENKNILAEKGSLYVGTGAAETVEILGNSYKIAQTGKLTPGPDSDNKVLVADSKEPMGLAYKNVKDIIGAATASTIGGVKIGDGLDVTPGGVLSLRVSANGNLGGIKVSVVSSLPTTLADDVFYFVTT